MMTAKCRVKTCRLEGQFNFSDFCMQCWHKLPKKHRDEILVARKVSLRDEVVCVREALQWMQTHLGVN